MSIPVKSSSSSFIILPGKISLIRFAIPRIPFKGVLISCEMLPIKASFNLLADSAFSFAFIRSCSTRFLPVISVATPISPKILPSLSNIIDVER